CTILSFIFSPVLAPTVLYTLSLHDALPIYGERCLCLLSHRGQGWCDHNDHTQPIPDYSGGFEQHHRFRHGARETKSSLPRPQCLDRKSTRLNSSHLVISYAVFCLKKKTK